jgi:hypothetical protein
MEYRIFLDKSKVTLFTGFLDSGDNPSKSDFNKA